MSASQRAAAANCPYALFDLRFHDEAHWSTRLRGAAEWRVADEGADEDTANFVRLALFYAWHVASTTRYAAQLLLGMSERTAGAFRATMLNCLPTLVASETANLIRALPRLRRVLERTGERRRAPGRDQIAQDSAVRSAAGGRLASALTRPFGLAGRQLRAGPGGFSLRGSYERPRPSTARQGLQKRHQGAQRHRSYRGGGRLLRAPGSERRGQDDGDRHHHLARQQDRRHGRGVRLRPGPPARAGEVLHRHRAAGGQLQHVRDGVHHRREPGGLLRHSAAARQGARGEISEAAAALGPPQFHRARALGRNEAAPHDRARVDARTEAPDPGRADRRRRHRDPQVDVGVPPQDQRRGNDHHPDHALPGGSGEPVPQRRHHRGRAHHRARLHGERAAQAPDGNVRVQFERSRGPLPRSSPPTRRCSPTIIRSRSRSRRARA